MWASVWAWHTHRSEQTFENDKLSGQRLGWMGKGSGKKWMPCPIVNNLATFELTKKFLARIRRVAVTAFCCILFGRLAAWLSSESLRVLRAACYFSLPARDLWIIWILCDKSPAKYKFLATSDICSTGNLDCASELERIVGGAMVAARAHAPKQHHVIPLIVR